MYKSLVILMVVLLTTPGLTVAAQTISQMQQQQQAVQAEVQEARGDLAETQREMELLDAEMKAMDLLLSEATDRLVVINQSLDETKVELEETEQALVEAQYARDEHFERFKTRLRVMYIQGPVGYLEVVLQANSFNDFLTRLYNMNAVARSDREMAERLREAEEVVEDKLEETFRHMTSIEAMQVVQSRQVDELYLLLDQKEDFMYHLAENAFQFEAHLLQLEQTEREIVSLIQRAQAEEEARRRAAAQAEAARRAAERAAQQQVQPFGGTMSWPVPGHTRVTSGYGNRQRPIGRGTEFHTGVDIGAPSGTNIIAAESGTVILSGWNGGFGNTVIIDHGGGRTTLYGHNSRNLVEVGQWVNRGDVIARVGSTGVSTGPHLHFEVRHNGNHVNPNPYLGI